MLHFWIAVLQVTGMLWHPQCTNCKALNLYWVLLQQTAYLVGPSTRAAVGKGRPEAACPLPSRFGCPRCWRMAHLLDESSLGWDHPGKGLCYDSSQHSRTLERSLCKGARCCDKSRSSSWKAGAGRGSAAPSPAGAEGTACAAGQLLFPRLTMANLLVTSQFREQNIVLRNYNAVLMLPLLALSSDNKTFCHSRCGMTAMNTHWVTPR